MVGAALTAMEYVDLLAFDGFPLVISSKPGIS